MSIILISKYHKKNNLINFIYEIILSSYKTLDWKKKNLYGFFYINNNF